MSERLLERALHAPKHETTHRPDFAFATRRNAPAAGVAKLLFFVFVVGFLVFLALGVFAGRKITGS